MKNWQTVVVVVVLAAAGIGGGFYLKHMVYQKAGNEVAKIVQSPAVQDQLKQALQSQAAQKQLQAAAGSVSNQAVNSTDHTKSSEGKQSVLQNSAVEGSSAEGSSHAAVPVFNSRQDAIQYAMSKLPPQEIARLLSAYANRQNLTQQQKDQIKAEVLSHFSSQELQAMLAAVKR